MHNPVLYKPENMYWKFMINGPVIWNKEKAVLFNGKNTTNSYTNNDCIEQRICPCPRSNNLL